MNTQEEVTSIIKKARTISIFINLISFMIGLASLGVVVFASFGIFDYPSNFQIFVLVAAIIVTLIMAWIAFSGIEKAGKLNALLMKDDFLADIAKNTEDGVLNLWRDHGGEKIFVHMADIKAPEEDQEDLYDSKKKIITAYMKVKTKARKALKNGWFTLWMMIAEIDEEYTVWFDETWNSALEDIEFYIQAYEEVDQHKDIPERLARLQVELWEEFRDSEDANYFRAIDIDRLLEMLSTRPTHALQAWEHIQELKDLESIADDEIEGAIDEAASSAHTTGVVTGMMYSNMMNSINNNNN